MGHLHTTTTTTTSAVIEVKTANSFNLFTITKYNNNKILSNRQDRLRYKNKIKSSSIITKIFITKTYTVTVLLYFFLAPLQANSAVDTFCILPVNSAIYALRYYFSFSFFFCFFLLLCKMCLFSFSF